MGSSASRRPRGVSTSSSASSVFSAPIVCSRSMAVRTERSSGGCTAFDRKVEMLLSVLLATEEASSSSSPPLRTKARQPLYSSSLILRHSSSRGVRNISGTCGNEYDPTHSHTHTHVTQGKASPTPPTRHVRRTQPCWRIECVSRGGSTRLVGHGQRGHGVAGTTPWTSTPFAASCTWCSCRSLAEHGGVAQGGQAFDVKGAVE